jgi:hypothetical protein
MHRILITSCAAFALAACGGPDADENPGDLNVVDNHVGPGNVLEPPTGNGVTVSTDQMNAIAADAANGIAPSASDAAPGAGNAAAGNNSQ